MLAEVEEMNPNVPVIATAFRNPLIHGTVRVEARLDRDLWRL
jgi:hypothetical protein